MRTFISIDLPENVKAEIKKVQDLLPKFIGKKTEKENLHLTLKFLGEIDDEKIEEVRNKLREIKFEKFETEIDSVGVFSEKFIRIVWLRMSGCNELQEKIDNKLNDLFETEERFMSHLTIARVKNVKNKKEFLEQIKKLKISKMSFLIENFKIKESLLTESGPVYKTLENYSLIEKYK